MGKVAKFVEKKEKEKHKTTEEFIDTLLWYVKSMNDAIVELTNTANGINTVFNEKMKEIKEEQKNA